MAELSVEDVVRRNLDAYNARDIDTFVSTFAPRIVMRTFPDARVVASGLEEVRAVYAALFDASPRLRSTITNRIVFGRYVVDHESIMGRHGSEIPLELVLIYEVEGDTIVEVTTLRL